MVKELAKKLYELFVVNRHAVAVQKKDGNYATQYMHVEIDDIECMLNEKKALGCYQQLYKSSYLKWICFDFDCKDKENPNIEELYVNCTRQLTDFLDEKEISYVNEFSGRRGIHTWILFDSFITKNDAYEIVQKIKKNINLMFDETLFGLDEFPATRSSKGNVLGKQVKIPLSVHTRGMQSFFFEGDFKYNKYGEGFLEEQNAILSKLKLNNAEEIFEKLGITENESVVTYKRVYVDSAVECSIEEVIKILSNVKAYKEIIHRITNGNAISKDWFVMLGTLGKLDKNKDLLIDLFRYNPNYSEKETLDKISKYSYKYFPPTFSYLYEIYNMEMEAGIDPKENGLQYLLRNLGCPEKIKELNDNQNELLDSCYYTREKELKYLFSNDEVPVVSVCLELQNMTKYDIKQIDEKIIKISNGIGQEVNVDNVYIFNRKESDLRERKMISLSASDRVLTSHLALKMYFSMNDKIQTFSYNPNFLSKDDIFWGWYTSWGNYLEQIRRYLELDIYENLNIITIDVKHFYDSIDFLGVFKLIKDSLDEEGINIIKYLISYNEKLMKGINGNRKGVPQGPAYARIIAEIFLGMILKKIMCKLKQDGQIHVYRYVDDIVIFFDDNYEGKKIFELFSIMLVEYGLELNLEKSKVYGKIKELSENDKNEILRKNKFEYGLRTSEYSYLIPDSLIKKRVEDYLSKKSEMDIEDISYLFSQYTDERAKKMYIEKYTKFVFQSEMGRGSSFTKFYRYVLTDEEILENCLIQKCFQEIPPNTINFKCCISNLYYLLKDGVFTDYQLFNIYECFINKIELDEIDNDEDVSMVCAIKEYMQEVICERI